MAKPNTNLYCDEKLDSSSDDSGTMSLVKLNKSTNTFEEKSLNKETTAKPSIYKDLIKNLDDVRSDPSNMKLNLIAMCGALAGYCAELEERLARIEADTDWAVKKVLTCGFTDVDRDQLRYAHGVSKRCYAILMDAHENHEGRVVVKVFDGSTINGVANNTPQPGRSATTRFTPYTERPTRVYGATNKR